MTSPLTSSNIGPDFSLFRNIYRFIQFVLELRRDLGDLQLSRASRSAVTERGISVRLQRDSHNFVL